ncbi:uncharacterized protein LOC107980919 isoform X1 [Nasonia vitripennis]|uniref:Uncharacterized protein n=1 Tax=Nasonia vitripennis TaxID=7425 RepID=A0A7M7ISM6_NASVI|nr:uncharacterized protein LOC107980919 isoform X1 [Nasonia vitripennis]
MKYATVALIALSLFAVISAAPSQDSNESYLSKFKQAAAVEGAKVASYIQDKAAEANKYLSDVSSKQHEHSQIHKEDHDSYVTDSNKGESSTPSQDENDKQYNVEFDSNKDKSSTK